MSTLEIRASHDLGQRLEASDHSEMVLLGAARESFAHNAPSRFAVRLRGGEGVRHLANLLQAWVAEHPERLTGLQVNGRAPPIECGGHENQLTGLADWLVEAVRGAQAGDLRS